MRVPVLNPFAYCEGCGGEVHSREAGVNYPCGEAAPIRSVCPTWTPGDGCRCSHPEPPIDAGDVEAAAALQEALEDQERQLGPGRILFPIDVPDPGPELPQPGDEVINRAQRLRALLSWGAFVLAVLMIAALFAPGGPW